MFQKILVANRGEIALRVICACKELGISTVAVYSEADRNSLHVRFADEAVCIGPPRSSESYLNIPQVISAAEITNVDAIHPGYGFLSENANFAKVCEASEITFIGPTPEVIEMMGEKDRARREMKALGVPTVPGSEGVVEGEEQLAKEAKRIGFPLIIKASAGGGGRGMRVARDESQLKEMLPAAQREAVTFFANAEVYLERHLSRPRHIEVQILADGQGGVIHLGERDCSLQRSHQKVLEETPSPALNAEQRAELAAVATRAIAKLGYKSAGTIEFLFEDGRFSFIEMNTRLQVEHPISEMVSGIDIVREQIRIASGAPLGYRQADVKLAGHAIECRINAEHPESFMPSPGAITGYHVPGGMGVRIDSALYQGYTVPPQYDSLVAKLIVHGTSRNECLMRLRRSLEEYVITGIDTTIPLHQRLVVAPDFINGVYDVHWLERFLGR
jgi:acetyl-CoA carboxylase, biotin carboxylase subunit